MILYFIILGIVQGLSEFLPISSSGHLVFLNWFFHIDGNFLLITIILHIATLLSVCIVYAKDIWFLVCHPFCNFAKKLYVATICSVLVVFVLNTTIKSAFSGKFLPICFLITSIVLFCAYLKTKQSKYLQNININDNKYNNNSINNNNINTHNINNTNISYKKAAIVGVVQGFAVFPGISRSGSTIATSLFLNIKSEEATKFSFLLSIPIILASLIFSIFSGDFSSVSANNNLFGIILGFVAALISGVFAILLMKKIAKTNKYQYFAAYVLVLAILSFFVIV